jgi:hypothetical protein
MTKWEIKHNTVYHLLADGKEITTCTSEEDAVMLLGYFLAAEIRKGGYE